MRHKSIKKTSYKELKKLRCLYSERQREGYLLPIGGGKYGVIPGADYPDVTLYLQACHNYTGDIDEAGARYGYNVKD